MRLLPAFSLSVAARHRRLVADQLDDGIMTQRVVIVLILGPGEHPVDPLPQQVVRFV